MAKSPDFSSILELEVSNLGQFSTPETLTIEAVTTNPTFGTLHTNETSIRQVGSEGEVRVEFRQSTAGGVGSGDYLFTLPDGQSFASGTDFYTGAPVVGAFDAQFFTGLEAGIGQTIGPALVVPYDATRYRLLFSASVSDGGTSVARTFNFAGSADANFSNSTWTLRGTFSVPIEGFDTTTKIKDLI